MADFLISFEKTNINEGGTADSSHDGGKFTWGGIASRWHPEFPGWPIIYKAVEDLGLTGKTLDNPHTWKQIDAALAGNALLFQMKKDFYKKEFWDKLNLDTEPVQIIADTAYDAGVNKAWQREKKWLAESRKEADEIV
jgi:lysozyme family protein